MLVSHGRVGKPAIHQVYCQYVIPCRRSGTMCLLFLFLTASQARKGLAAQTLTYTPREISEHHVSKTKEKEQTEESELIYHLNLQQQQQMPKTNQCNFPVQKQNPSWNMESNVQPINNWAQLKIKTFLDVQYSKNLPFLHPFSERYPQETGEETGNTRAETMQKPRSFLR